MKQYIHLTAYERYRTRRGFSLMTTESGEWFRQAQYDLGTAESLVSAERYPPAIFFCHLALEKCLKALYTEKYNDNPKKDSQPHLSR